MTQNKSNKTGKPARKNKPPIKKKKYTDKDLFKAKVEDYFNKCDKTVIKKQVVTRGEIIIVETPKPYTMAGLAYHLDIERQTLNNYKSRETYFDIIMHARKRIEEANISLAMVGCHDSKIAALNLASNYGYAVKQDLNVEGDGLKPTRSPEEVEAMKAASIAIVKALK